MLSFYVLAFREALLLKKICLGFQFMLVSASAKNANLAI